MAFTPKFTLFELTTRVETPVVKINPHRVCSQPRHNSYVDLKKGVSYSAG